jgi:hypothetical protein
MGIVQVPEVEGFRGTCWHTGGFQALLGPVVAVVAFDGLLGDRIHVDHAVRTDLDAGAMPTANVVIDGHRASTFLVDGTAGAGFQTGSILAMLACHGQEHSCDLGILTDILVKSLSDIIAQWHIVL